MNNFCLDTQTPQNVLIIYTQVFHFMKNSLENRDYSIIIETDG